MLDHATLHAEDPDRRILYALEITHPGLDAPLRIINDTAETMVAGDTYTPAAFQIVPPGQHSNKTPNSQISIANIGAPLTKPLRATHGARGATARLLRLLSGELEPDNISEFGILTAVITDEAITLEIGVDNDLNSPAVALRYTPKLAPGIFN